MELIVSIPPVKLDASNRRCVHRNYAFVLFPIHELKNPLNKGIVVDISEANLKISGITAYVGDTKEFRDRIDHFADVSPFVFEAPCP